MNFGPRTWCIPVFVLFSTLVSSSIGCTQEAEVPRDQTPTAIFDSAFSYAEPEEVGISGAALEVLARLIAQAAAPELSPEDNDDD